MRITARKLSLARSKFAIGPRVTTDPSFGMHGDSLGSELLKLEEESSAVGEQDCCARGGVDRSDSLLLPFESKLFISCGLSSLLMVLRVDLEISFLDLFFENRLNF
jgi:hypothetical protein